MRQKGQHHLVWCKSNCSFWPWILSHYDKGSNTSLFKTGIITINTFLPTRNKFVYSCSIKIHASGTLGKHFLPPDGCGSIFPEKSCRDAWRSGSRLAKGQVIMVDEAKLCTPIRSIFEALIMRSAIGCYHGEVLGPFCWPIPAADIAIFGAAHWFAEPTS